PLAGDRDLGREREWHALRQPDEAAGRREQAPLHLREPEDGVVRRHDEVAREHDLEAAGQRRPVDGGDEGLGASALRGAAEPAPLRHQLEAATGCDQLEVGTGREDGSTAGDDDGPDLVVGFDVVEGTFDAPGDVAVDGVAGFGPVDREDLDPTSSFPLDDHDYSCRRPASDRTGAPRRRSTMPGATEVRTARAW